MKRGERKFEEINGLKFTPIYENTFGRVIQTKGSSGYQIRDSEFNFLGFYIEDPEIVIEELDRLESELKLAA